MKKIFSLAAIILLASSVCFAQQPPYTPIQTNPKAAVETKTLTGKVESVTLADATKGIKSEIVVADDNGNKTTLSVKTTTTISDAEWKTISLDKIKKDDLVKVRYVATKEGINEATSITLKKQ